MWFQKSALRSALVLVSFLIVAAFQSWPLPLHISTHLTGDPGGDTGVYIWNSWVFSHELLSERSWPFSTEAIFGLSGPVDLSLHNYTVFSNLLALPLQPWLGVVAAFNLTYLVNVALAGWGMFLLVRHLSGKDGGAAEAWLAGLLFACSPFLVARSTAHFSLVAAAPLPFFALFFDRTWQTGSRRSAAAAGACIAWAGYCDAYYAVYCGLLAVVITLARTTTVSLSRVSSRWQWVPSLDVPVLLLVAAIALVNVAAGGVLQVAGVTVSMRTLYTPVLLLTVLVTARMWLMLRPRVAWTGPRASMLGPALTLSVVTLLLLSPVLYAMVHRTIDGRMVHAPVLWRSSAPGVDLASMVLPNPNHPLAPDSIVRWVAAQPGRFEENVASIPWTVFFVIGLAALHASYRPNRTWMLAAVFFASLAAGPFIRIAGVETYLPTPWTFLRYLPLIGEARMPARFSVLVALAMAILFAGALAALARRWPTRRRLVLGAAAGVLVMELLPVPRTLHRADTPEVFAIIAADPRPVRVLHLPFGIRDGLSSLGDFSSWTLYQQTHHGKAVFGGYLSRVSERRKDHYLSDPMAAALLLKSERRALSDDQRAAAQRTGADFVRRANIGWVVVDETRTSAELQVLAIDALRLTLRARSGVYALYAPSDWNDYSVR